MSAVASGALLEELAFRYADLGRPVELTPLHYEFKVSNSLFLYRTTDGRFLLKSMAHPHALYGQSDVAERLEWVGKALQELQTGGLPVERLLSGRGGRYVLPYHDHLLRLYAFSPGRPFADPEADSRRSARSLGRLHREGLGYLSEASRQALSRYTRPYALELTARDVPALRRFVAQRAAGEATFAEILAQWDTVEWAVRRSLDHHPLTASAECLIHGDFHPRNALFFDGGDEAFMVDFDNMMIDRPHKCLGLSILRFAFFRGGPTLAALRHATSLFIGDAGRDPGFAGDLTLAMISLEIEKVLRILHRVMTTGEYAGFLDNIVPVHLSNLMLLRTAHAGQRC